MWGRGSPHLQACKKRAHQTPTRSAARQVAITTHHRSGFSQFLHREPERPCARTNCDQHTHTTHNGTYATKQTRALVWGKNRISLRLEPRRARSERQAVDTTAKTSTSTRLVSPSIPRCRASLTELNQQGTGFFGNELVLVSLIELFSTGRGHFAPGDDLQ